MARSTAGSRRSCPSPPAAALVRGTAGRTWNLLGVETATGVTWSPGGLYLAAACGDSLVQQASVRCSLEQQLASHVQLASIRCSLEQQLASHVQLASAATTPSPTSASTARPGGLALSQVCCRAVCAVQACLAVQLRLSAPRVGQVASRPQAHHPAATAHLGGPVRSLGRQLSS